MCHAIPAEVVEVMDGAMARVDVSGARKTVSTALVGEVSVGEYLLVHVGYALGRVDQAEAAETLRLLEEIGATS